MDDGIIQRHGGTMTDRSATASLVSKMLFNTPREIRRQMYRHIFTDSALVFAPHERADTTSPVRKAQSGAFTVYNHPAILLTCKQCYTDGRSVYLEEVRLFSNGYSFGYVAAVLGDFTIAHLRHLGGSDMPSPDERSFNKLRLFTNLRTCEAVLGNHKQVPVDAGSLRCEHLVDYMKRKFLRSKRPGTTPAEYDVSFSRSHLEHHSMLDALSSVAFLARITVSFGCPGCNKQAGRHHEAYTCYFNLSAERFFLTPADNEWSHERAYDRLLASNWNIIDGDGSQTLGD